MSTVLFSEFQVVGLSRASPFRTGRSI